MSLFTALSFCTTTVVRFVVRSLALSLVLVAMACHPALAATWIINPTGTGDDFPNLQAALSSSLVNSGDTIALKDGTYSGLGNYNVDFLGKNVVVRSLNMNPANCIIDCQGSVNTPRRAFFFQTGETSAAWLQAIKIIHAVSVYSPGGALYISGASPVIDKCIFQACMAEGSDGGAIWCGNGAAPIIQNCTITACGAGGIPAGHGGGIFGDATSTPYINTCTLTGNIAASSQQYTAGGGGIFVSGGNIDFCIVASNHADGPGGGIHATGMQVAYSDIRSNSTTYGNGGGVFLDNAGLTFSSITGNTGVGGGGVYAQGSTIGKCTITGNTSPGDGGGGVFCYASNIQETTISGNNAMAGGGIEAFTTTLTTTILWGNCATLSGNEVYGDATVTLSCCCVNTAGVFGAVTYSGAQVYSSPLFCAAVNCNSAPSTGGDYSLSSASPCLPGGNACTTLIGALGQGCTAADVADPELSGIELKVPAISRGTGEISWMLPEDGRVRLSIHDTQGREVAILTNELTALAGAHHSQWSGRDAHGARLPRGVYFARLETSRSVQSRKTILLGD